MVDIRELVRTKAQRTTSPSRRLPHCSTRFVSADCIERQLQEDNHTIWGWRLYRCTYRSDKQWAEFVTRLWLIIDDNFSEENAMDLKASMDMQIIEGPALDESHPDVIRQMFRQWSKTACRVEQGFAWKAQRYMYCLYVDQKSLESVLADPPEERLGGGYVNILNCTDDYDAISEDDPEGDEVETGSHMRLRIGGLMTTWYNLLRGGGAWAREYRRPPIVNTP